MKTKILLVEDDPFWHLMIGEYLRGQYQDIEFTSVQSIHQAITRLEKSLNAFNLIISDYFLNEEATGIDLWRQCQTMGSEIPFVIISGLKKNDFIDLIGDEENIPLYIEKPFDFKRLNEVIETACYKKQI